MAARDPDRGRLLAVTFNVWVGQTPQRLRGNLRELVADIADEWDERPHVLALQEAKRFDGTIPGYVRHAEDEGHEDNSSTVILVRDDVRMTVERDVDVAGPWWVGPKHGIKHPPRYFPGASLSVDGRMWDVLAVHRTPGGPLSRNARSWAAEHRALIRYADRREDKRPNRPMAILGDMNNRAGDPRPKGIADLARKTDSALLMRGIDGALVRNCGGRARKLRHKYGSDKHRPVVLDLRTKEK